jgi:autotransporter-associated beta strand protein
MLVTCLTGTGAAQAAAIYWDGLGTNGSGASGDWGATNNWSQVSTDTTPDPLAVPGSGDDVFFNITPSNSMPSVEFVNLNAARAAQSLTFNAAGGVSILNNKTGTSPAQTFTLGSGGITMNPGSGPVILNAASGTYGSANIIIGAAQTWQNNSSSNLSLFANGTTAATISNALTISGSGNMVIGQSSTVYASLLGSGGITKTGTGTLTVNPCGGSDRWHIGGNHGGDFTMQNGTLNVTAKWMVIYDIGATSGNYHQTGGTATHAGTDASGNGLYIGFTTSGSGSNSTFAISGGSFTESGNNTAVWVGRASGSTTNFNAYLNVGGGAGSASFTAPTVHLGGSSANTANIGNLNLITNGTLTTLLVDKPGGAGNLIFDGGTLHADNRFSSGNTILSNVLNVAQIKNGGAVIDSNGKDVVIAQGFANFPGHSGSLTKVSNGTLTLSGTNTFSGATTINGGTLALSTSGSLRSAFITNNGTFDVSVVAGGYHLVSGQTMFGAGSVNGPTTVDVGAVITPGGASGGTATLNHYGALTLNGTAVMRIDKGNSTNDVISVHNYGLLTLNGTLEIHLINGGVSNGDQFQLFNSSSFAGNNVGSINITGDSIAPLYWDTSQLASGILAVTNTLSPPVLTGPFDTSGECNVTVTASATGTPPLVYCWSLDNSPFAKGTNLSSITISTPSSATPHQVSLYVTNAEGFSMTNTASVTVQDTTAPVITLNGANPIYVLVNTSYIEPGFTVTDNCSSSLTLTTNNTVNIGVAGTYINTYLANDGNNNIATNSRTVIVQPSCIWTSLANGAWANRLNWENQIAANYTNAAADFSTLSLSSNLVVTVDGTNVVGSLWLDDQSGNDFGWTFNYGTGGAILLAVTNGAPVISNNVPTAFWQVLLGTQGFTKSGAGTLAMNTSSSPISGNVNVENGTLQLGQVGSSQLLSTTNILGTTNSGSAVTTLRFGPTTGNPMGSGPIIISSNAPSSVAMIDGNPASSGVGNVTNSITLQAGRSITFTNSGAQIYNLSGIITGTGDVIVATTNFSNRVRLNYTNSFSGNLYITSGGVQITDSAGPASDKNVIPDSADVNMSANTIMAFSANETFGALNGDATAVVGEIFSAAGTSFTMTLGANNNDGTFNGSIWLADVGNPAAQPSMPLSIVKIGTGTQTFNGACSNTAPTFVDSGALIINNSYASPVTVSKSATLGGTGTLSAPITVQAGGTLSPGASIGTLTINNNLTLAGNLYVEVNKALSPAQTNDYVVVSGVLTNAGTGTVTVTNLNLAKPFALGDKFRLFSQPLANGGTMTISPASPGAGLAWFNSLSIDGSLQVVTPSALSSNAFLTSLVISPAAALNPAFTTNNFSYTATNAFLSNPVTVTAIAADPGATLQLSFNGGAFVPLTSGTPSASQTLILPTNTVTVKVTAADNSTTQTYNVNVTLQPSLTLAKLTNSVSGSTLTLSWPADHLGWHLQMQINTLGAGLKSNAWVVVPGSDQMTSTNISITKTNPTVFYRITYP